MSYAEIRTALETRLATVTGLPDTDRWALENTAEDFDAGEAWLAVRHGFGPETRLTMLAANARMQKDGTTRLLLYSPLSVGAEDVDTVVQATVDAFPPGLTLTSGSTTVHVDSSRRFGGGRDLDAAWYVVPVDIRWHVFATSTLT